MAIADFGAGVQAVKAAMIHRAMAAAELQRRIQGDTDQREHNAKAIDLREREFGLQDELAHRPAPPDKPMVVGGRLVTPSGQVLYDPPKEPDKPRGPVTLSPGSQLVDPTTGRLITSAPRAPEAAKPSMQDELAQFEAKEKIKAQYGGAKPSLGAEKNALNYFNRMLEAERNARAVENDVGTWDTAMSGLPMVPEFAENLLKSEKGQKYTQAQRMFTEARLRKESGAAIPENEFANDRRMNFKAVGDKPETLTQKRAARLTTMRGIGQTAGRAVQEYYGNDATLDSLLKEFAGQEAGGDTGSVIRQRNARTGQMRISHDGGKTWQIQ